MNTHVEPSSAALDLPGSPFECDLCRRHFSPGDAFYRVTLGMDTTPSIIGRPAHEEPSVVEEVSELVVCAVCEPTVAGPLEALLSAIWSLRRPDPADEEDEPTVPVPPPSAAL